MTSFMPSPKDRKSQANLSQLVHCQECISGPVSWSHSKRWYWFSLEAWPLRCRCPADLVSCPLCEALAICLICGRSDGCERNLQLNFQICVCVIWQHGERGRRKKKKSVKCFAAGEIKIFMLHRLFDYFDPKMVCGNKVKLFHTYISLNGILAHLSFTYLKTYPRCQHSDSIPVRRQNELWRKITQDSSSRVRNLKHPAMCTASSRAPGGARWMPISLLFCHAVPPVSRQSCHRYSLYMETDTSRCGTWVYTTRTCVIDAKHFLPGCLCEPHEHSRSVHCTDTYTVLGRSLNQRAFQRGSFFMCCTDNNDDDDDDQLQSHTWRASQPTVDDVPRGCT